MMPCRRGHVALDALKESSHGQVERRPRELGEGARRVPRRRAGRTRVSHARAVRPGRAGTARREPGEAADRGRAEDDGEEVSPPGRGLTGRVPLFKQKEGETGMSRKKRTPWKKRCHCREQASCAHPWWLRLKVKGGKQDRWNLTEMFPDDAVEIAAAKARTQARSGRG